MANTLQQGIERVLREYPAARTEALKDHPLARFIRTELPALLEQGLQRQIGDNKYVVAGTKFMGNWANVPWLSILDPQITDSNQRGIYFVCLFAEDGACVALAVGEGVTESTADAIAEDRALILQAHAVPSGFQPGPVSEGVLGQSSSAKSYEQGTICYTRYARGSVPPDSELLKDIQGAVDFVSKTAASSVYRSLSFFGSTEPNDNSVSFRGVSITRSDIRDAFANATPSDWDGLRGQDPYWMIEVDGERKPLKAVLRKASDSLTDAEFTSHEAARIVRQLGFLAINEREERALTGKSLARQWSFAPGRDADRWPEVQASGEITIGWDELGDLSRYKSMDEILEALKKAYGESGGPEPTNNARCNWEYSHVIKPGDLIYARKGRRHLLGIGEVTGPYRWVEARPDHKHVIPVKWLKIGDWQLAEGSAFGIKTLTNITPDPELVENLNLLAGFPQDAEPETAETIAFADSPKPTYSLEDLAADTGFSIQWLQSLISRVHRKKHLVLQGPPGTGKTFIGKSIVRHLIGGTTGISEIVQFHPSYSYEDFVQGLKPHSTGGSIDFVLEPGRFLRFCSKARIIAPAPAVLIIDEFNRANLSRVFGELMYLLEYRGESVPLASGGAPFSIPENIRIIATMNTADRSIALVDHALRRRFSFAYVAPDYTVLANHLAKHGLPHESLVSALRQVNLAIGDKHYEVGISFFLADGATLRESLQEIWVGEIEPYLDDYFFDEPQKADALRWNALRATVLVDWQ